MAKAKGSPKTGGRLKGSKNKATADIKALCQAYTEQTVKELYRIALNADSDQARVAAIKEIHDRGFGRPAQSVAIGQDEELGPVQISWTEK